MKLPIMIYLRANKPYWFAIDPHSHGSANIVRVNSAPLAKGTFGTLPADSINLPLFVKGKEKHYDIYQDDTLIVIGPTNAAWLVPDKSFSPHLQTFGNAFAEKLRNRTKTALIEELSSQNATTSTDNVLEAFKKYTFFDGASAWLYNEETKAFTRIAGDVTASASYVEEKGSKVLSQALREEAILPLPLGEGFDVPDSPEADYKWVNAFRVKTTSSGDNGMGISAVVCLYSKYADYNLRDQTRHLMGSFLQQNLAKRYFDRLLRLTALRGHIRMSFSLDNRRGFLCDVAEHICKDLAWESCSIFTKSDSNPKSIEIQASYPKIDEGNLNKRGYQLNSPGLTSKVLLHNRMFWSYDIEHDDRNTHGFDDPTITAPRNWIGVPIATGASKLGVIRVKNKIAQSGDDDLDFSVLDMHILQAIAGELASVLHQFEIFAERKLLADQRQKELAQLEDFLKTFRHEIRSPIQAVCFAPERIGLLLKEEFAVFADNVPKRFREFLLDFKATGNRLEMISKALTLDPEELVREVQLNNIFKDCVAPVLAFVVPYAKKKGRHIHVDKDSLLVNMHFDAVSMTMACHVLIDNAVKYTDKNRTIKIFGKIVPGGHQIVVESDSDVFIMSDEDVAHFRDKYFRGGKAREQKLEGSGIGLYLADRIMALHGGSLDLLRPNKPVTFALTLND